MKKIILKFLIACITLFIWSNNVLAYTTTLSPSKSTVLPETSFTIKINMSALDNGLGSAQYTLGFNNDLFEVVKVDTKAVQNTLANSIKFTFVDMTGTTPLSNGTFATITFKAKKVSTDQTGNFTLTSAETSDKENNSITSTNKGTSVKIHIPDTDNTLNDLKVNATTIEGFAKDKLNYYINTEASSIKIDATKNSQTSSVTGTGTKTVNYGENNYDIVVTSESGTKRIYRITVTRVDNRDKTNTLEKLEVVGYKLSPTFSKLTTTYTLNVKNNITSIKINATPTSNKSTFEKGFGPRTENLNYGKNTLYIKVKSENEKVKTYTLIVNREDIRNSNNNLKKLEISTGKINFNKDTTVYAIITDKNEITINAEAEHEKAIVTGNKKYNLQEGLNEIVVSVKAENETIKTYTIKVTKISNLGSVTINNNLSNININNYNINFESNILEYKLKIGTEDKLEIDYQTEDESSIVEIKGNENLKNGSVISIIVTAVDGTKKEYKIIIEKEEKIIGEKKNNNIILYILLAISVTLNIVLSILLIKKNKTKKEEIIKPEIQVIEAPENKENNI